MLSDETNETGYKAFELRLWDSRLGRWFTNDPYNQFASPYLGMGNNPVILFDMDGGSAGDNDDIWVYNVVTGEYEKVSDDYGPNVHVLTYIDNEGREVCDPDIIYGSRSLSDLTFRFSS